MAKYDKFNRCQSVLALHNYDKMISLATFIARIYDINVIDMFGKYESERRDYFLARCAFFGAVRVYEKSSYERIADMTDCFARHYSVPEVEAHIKHFFSLVKAKEENKERRYFRNKWLDVTNLIEESNESFF